MLTKICVTQIYVKQFIQHEGACLLVEEFLFHNMYALSEDGNLLKSHAVKFALNESALTKELVYC
jgi:hypothetical protein